MTINKLCVLVVRELMRCVGLVRKCDLTRTKILSKNKCVCLWLLMTCQSAYGIFFMSGMLFNKIKGVKRTLIIRHDTLLFIEED
jgi:hypothetical protein